MDPPGAVYKRRKNRMSAADHFLVRILSGARAISCDFSSWARPSSWNLSRTTLDSQVAISNFCKIRSQPYHGRGKTRGTYFFNRAGCKVQEDATVVILYQHLSS